MAAISASIFGSFWVALGLLILFTDLRAFRRAGPLRHRRTRVADLEEGKPAKLVGVVRLADGDLRAPLSGRSCAGWAIDTARRRLLRWKPVGARTEATGFYLDDGSGEVFVPLGARSNLHLGVCARARKRRRRSPPRNLRPLLEPHLEAHPDSAYRCDERAIVEGMRVSVYGVFRARPDARPSEARTYRGRSYCFVAEPDPTEGVHVSDERATLG